MGKVMVSRNQKAVPEMEKTLKQFKYEIIDETGIKFLNDGYSVERPSKKCGYLGDYMVKKLIMISEEQLIGRK